SLSSECIPGLMSVWETCDGRGYSNTLRSEIQMQLQDVVSALLGLVDHIPREEIAVQGLEGKREEILAATGQIWKTCDRMNQVAQMGIVGLAVEQVDAYHALVKDAVEELEAWDPDEEEESLFGGSSDSGMSGRGVKKANGDINENVHHEHSDPAPPTLDGLEIHDLHAGKEGAVKVLKLIRMLYPALRKRRVSAFPVFERTSALDAQPSEDQIAVLDQLLRHLQGFSDEADEVAGALYGGDVREVRRRLESLKRMAEGCVDEVKKGWTGEEDEFSAWSGKWVQRLKEAGL
ncbi:MAG: hypothetical protein Q9211_006838, partial [Gyalolechia sp. 1 TL-2023]